MKQKTVRKTLGKEAPKQSTMSTHNYSWSAGTSTITTEIHYDGFVTTVKQSSTLIQLVRQNRRRAPSDSHGSRPSVTYMSANTTSQKQADTNKAMPTTFPAHKHLQACWPQRSPLTARVIWQNARLASRHAHRRCDPAWPTTVPG